MADYQINKKKILNDPVFGFITIPHDIVFDVIEHPWFQRLRRIKQLGLTSLVYPGALHTRFHHAIGAMGLMQEAIKMLEDKGQTITEDEKLGTYIAILLHDIGHGPFSHALEYSIVSEVKHEKLSLLFMEKLNEKMNGQLNTAIRIFKNEYPKKFLHQLVSGQLDVDRLDYLKRDSFFTGVSEGIIGTERIIKMLNVFDDQLVIESKGIYSIEKFILARRLMYWQVYLHKTVLSAEQMLVKILQRAKELTQKGEELFATPDLSFFLKGNYNFNDFFNDQSIINRFANIDDYDISSAIKVWAKHDDKVLSDLSQRLINRELYRLEIQTEPFEQEKIKALEQQWQEKNPGLEDYQNYYIFTGTTENKAYNPEEENIKVLHKGGHLKDLTDSSEELNVSTITQTIHKNYLCYPKNLVKFD
ncbi:MAG: HD domain-containing protein [Bacteroidales bacterium]|nr:HD domain-containing protein [Bacteroidales bacterium]MCF8327530.1 HD domain-containing protein [Bacteroidales bacterium]